MGENGRARRVTLGVVTTAAVAITSLVVVRASAGEPRDRNGRVSTVADSAPQSIVEAEAQGRLHPRSQRSPSFALSSAMRDSLRVGTDARTCVDASAAFVARSGDFVAGPFALYRYTWTNGIKVSWHPGHQSRFRSMQATIRATPLDAPGPSRVYLSSVAGAEQVVLGRQPLTARWFRLPSAGRWMLVATAGVNWGCFIITLE